MAARNLVFPGVCLMAAEGCGRGLCLQGGQRGGPNTPRSTLGLDRVPHAPRSMFNGLCVSSSPEILDTGIQVAFLLPRYWPRGCNEGSSVPTLKSTRCWLEMDEGTRTMGAELGPGTRATQSGVGSHQPRLVVLTLPQDLDLHNASFATPAPEAAEFPIS